MSVPVIDATMAGMSWVSHPALIGRRAERDVVDSLLAGARSGSSGVLVVRGEAGIGKTALLSQVFADATDFRVLHVLGAELEMELAYASVQQLCTPLLHLARGLPEPQRHALNVALGLETGAAPDRLLVGLAILTLFGIASAEQPTAVVVDDAHWIDKASLQTLAFLARRIKAEPLVILFAARDGTITTELRGLPMFELAGLNEQDSRELLDSAMTGRIDEGVKSNILAEAQGNPLALLELHNALASPNVAGGFGLPHAADARVLEHGFVQRVRDLPPESLRLLLLAAAEPAGRHDWLLAAAEHLGIDFESAVTPAETAGLVTVEHGLRFRHPLIRSAIYQHVSPAERRSAHASLAAVITQDTADDHRAWHRAQAVSGRDDGVADELERSAQRAQARGGVAAAAAFLAHSAAMTSDPHLRATRALAAARAKLDAGLPQAIPELLAATDATDNEFLRAQADLVRARAAYSTNRGIDAPALLRSAAERLSRTAPELARETYLQAVTAAILVGRCAIDSPTSAPEIAKPAALAPPAPQRPRAVDLLLDGLIVRLTEGHAAAAPHLRRALDAYLSEAEAGTADPRWHDATNRVALELFDGEAFNVLNERQLIQLRCAGALSGLPVALQTCASTAIHGGDFARAERLLDESKVIESTTGSSLPGGMRAYLLAYRGDEEQCLDLVQSTILQAHRRGEGSDITSAHYSASILHLGLGQYQQAFDATVSAGSYPDIALRFHVLYETVEAAVRCGEHEVAARAAHELRQAAVVCNTDLARGMVARSTALVDDEVADAAFPEAIECLQRTSFLIYVHRARLLYGEWLRRRNRRADARIQLRLAYDDFTGMGARGFASRARSELEASGESVPHQDARPGAGLSVQEARIVRLVREGCTNVEIGTQLFISPRTVEWHLSRIFGKLEVTSRRQLRQDRFAHI